MSMESCIYDRFEQCLRDRPKTCPRMIQSEPDWDKLRDLEWEENLNE